jgi:hypothetical protein
MAKRTWFLLALAIIGRLFSIWFLKTDLYFELIPRSFTGRALLSQPAWLDLAIPLVIIVLCWPKWSHDRLTARAIGLAALDAAGLLMFPLLTGLALFVYVQDWFVSLQINWSSLMRWTQFVLAFLALNLLMDALPIKNRWGRGFVALAVGLALAVTQDITLTLTTNPEYVFIGLLAGVGTTLGLTALAFRPHYRQAPWRATAAAIFVGSITCFLIVAGQSVSLFTFLLPGVALLIGALAIRSPKTWPRWVALASLMVLSLGLSLVLPRLVPPDFAARMVENIQSPLTTVQVGKITVRYEDPRVRNIAVRMAHVLDSANTLSQDEFGVSPQVNELIIYGIAPGGFQAEFPHRIVGNFASEQQLQLSLDSAYLNAPAGSIHFPDPVNAILHEYSHLYGVVPYAPWVMGSENEGWATYAATRLSLRLFEKYGPELWDPPYNYAARARAITQSNLDGHSVVWSHPYEFGGFRLWNTLGERDGEAALFRERWMLTQRNMSRLVTINDPGAAHRLADGLGQSDFIAAGKAEPVLYDQVIAQRDWVSMGEVMGITPDQSKALYTLKAQQLVNPAVTVPASTPWGVEGLATLAVMLLLVSIL